MGLFVQDDPGYNENTPQTGFGRYKQLLSIRFSSWFKINLITLLGFLPLAVGITCAIATSSVLLLIPCSLAGGIIAGPFLAGLYDAILRGLRDDPLLWTEGYARSWRQNWKGSLLPGALIGLLAGLYAFMAMLFWWAETSPSPGTMLLYLFALLLLLVVCTLYWPQLVLFDLSPMDRLRNCVLFCVKYFWRVMGVGLLQLAYLAILVLFAPWTVFLLPVTGAWYIVFLAQLLIYDQLDESFQMKERFEETAKE